MLRQKEILFGKSTNTQRSLPLFHLYIFVSFTGDELWVEFGGGGLRFWMRSLPVFLFLPVSDMVFMGRCIIYLHYMFKICPLFISKASPKNRLFWLIYIYFFYPQVHLHSSPTGRETGGHGNIYVIDVCEQWTFRTLVCSWMLLVTKDFPVVKIMGGKKQQNILC